MKKVVLLSGGIDSTTCLALALQDCIPKDVLAVNIYYGQRHDREMRSAKDIAAFYGVELLNVDLSVIFQKSDCSLLKHSCIAVPKGSYAEQQKENPENPVSTYVPFRNGLMLSAAASIAISAGAECIYYGAHADDAVGNAYPDCSVEFTSLIDKAIYEGSGKKVSVIAPFAFCNKAQVVKTGVMLNAPYHLTWSCYNGGDKPCGKCGTCIDRAKAFEINGISDPAL